MAKQKITIVRGTTNEFSLIVTDADGELYPLASGEVIKFGVKKSADDVSLLISKTISSAEEDGSYLFEVEPSDTAQLAFGTYYYDIGLKSGNDYYNIIPCSPFVVGQNITTA